MRRIEGGGRIYSFTEGGNSVEVFVSGRTGGVMSIDFFVGGDTSVRGRTDNSSNNAIASKVSQVVRADISRRPEGQRFTATPANSDGRGAFREAMYARAGFSFKGGRDAKGGFGPQSAIVRNGRLVPADSDGRPFSAQQMASHRSAVRSALRDGIRDARRRRAR